MRGRFSGGEGTSKGSGGFLGEGKEGVRPNRSANGDGHWKGVG